MTSAEYREARTRDQEMKPTQARKIAAKQAAYRAEHKDEIAAKQAAYRAARRKMEVRTCVQ